VTGIFLYCAPCTENTVVSELRASKVAKRALEQKQWVNRVNWLVVNKRLHFLCALLAFFMRGVFFFMLVLHGFCCVGACALFE